MGWGRSTALATQGCTESSRSKVLPEALAADPERLRRFKREATAAAALNHPHICTIHEIGEADGRAFIAMEYVEGTTLRDRVASGRLSVPQVLSIGLQIADALEAARQKHIVHRDLKSANVILTPREQVKILDFGLAKQLVLEDAQEGATTMSGTTREGVVMGTLGYMAPEQALGRPVDHRSDLFSLGVVLYELLTGRLPFFGDSAPQVLDALLHQAPPALRALNREVPPDLARVLDRLLEKDRERRYQAAEDVSRDLRAIEEGARPRRWRAAQATAWPRHWRAALLGGGALVLGAVFLLRVDAVRQRIFRASEAAIVVALPAQVYGAPEYEYLTDAVPASLSTHLTGVDGLETKVPPSAAELQPIRGDLTRVAEVYGVTVCVLSSVTADGDRLALNVQLVEPRTRRVQWSQQYRGTARALSGACTAGSRGLTRSAESPSRTVAGDRGSHHQLGGRAGASPRPALCRALQQST